MSSLGLLDHSPHWEKKKKKSSLSRLGAQNWEVCVLWSLWTLLNTELKKYHKDLKNAVPLLATKN